MPEEGANCPSVATACDSSPMRCPGCKVAPGMGALGAQRAAVCHRAARFVQLIWLARAAHLNPCTDSGRQIASRGEAPPEGLGLL